MVPLSRLPINTGESTGSMGGRFFEKERNTRGGKILEKERRVDEQRVEDKKREEKFFGEQREASCRNGEEKGRKKRKRRTERVFLVFAYSFSSRHKLLLLLF
jgi:hypothetical protein